MHKVCQMDSEEMFDTNANINLALLQIRSIQVEQGLSSPTTLLFYRPKQGKAQYSTAQ